MTKSKGVKHDEDKLRFDLIDPEFTQQLALVMTSGARKYRANNWQKLKDFDARYTAALHRHLNARQLGEINDPETGLSHMAHAAANAMFLFWKEVQDADTNIR